jgi:amino acid transporter
MLWPLVVATFFMVSGGAYGTEDIIGGAGFARGIFVLALTPVLWSLPTSLMIGELASAMPAEGGYYAWVRRAMGDFWGFQEAWLSLVASIFDMAIYPTLFVIYLTRLFPWFGVGHRGVVVAVAMVVVCAALNIAGIRVVAGTSLWLFVLLTAPFVVVVALALTRHGALAVSIAATPTAHIGIVGGILVSMWNYMGWDNASTVAGEVHEPQRTYPRAMFAAVTIVAISYIVPFAAMWLTGISPALFETGSWANIAEMLGGHWLSVAVVAGGMISAFGMFNALVMSYSRLPLAMAQDGLLPRVFARTVRSNGAPWPAIVVLAVAWAMCLGIGFERLITLDILLYGGGLILEFIALAVLRITAPELPRPYRVPGGVAGTVALSIPVILLLGFSIVQSRGETVFGMNALMFGALLIIAGVAAYLVRIVLRGTKWFAAPGTED